MPPTSTVSPAALARARATVAAASPLRRRARRAAVVVAPVARRARRAASALGQSSMMQEGITALALGYAQRMGFLARVPTIAVLGAEGTIALAGYIWAKNGGPKLAGTVGRVAGIVALNHIGRVGLGGTPAAAGVAGDEYDALSGDDD